MPPTRRTEFWVALRHEDINLLVLRQTFLQVDPAEAAAFIQRQPYAAAHRRLWFWYEFLTGLALPLPDLRGQRYLDILPADRYVTATGVRVRRYGLRNNLLGTPAFCPVIRRTPLIEKYAAVNWTEKCQTLLAACPPQVYDRVLNHLYLSETQNSWRIEGEVPRPNRTYLFMDMLRQAGHQDFVSHDGLSEVVATILDSRDPAVCRYRTRQNFVGVGITPTGSSVDMVPPRPEEVPDLMDGLIAAHRIMQARDVHPVAHAAAIAFGMVFIHPFMDGNGRTHRFLLHNILARRAFTAPDTLFPVSSHWVKQHAMYRAALANGSAPTVRLSDWIWQDGTVKVLRDNSPLFRYMDMTVQTEALFKGIAYTLREEIQTERDYLMGYDEARRRMDRHFNLPNAIVGNLIRCCCQHDGRLSKKKRRQFPDLSDADIRVCEEIIAEASDLTSSVSSREDLFPAREALRSAYRRGRGDMGRRELSSTLYNQSV